MWQFFFSSCFCFCYYFFEWVSDWMSEWVSEWVSCVAPTIVSSGSPHRVWERGRESQRERSVKAAQVGKCVCASVCGSTPAYTNTSVHAAHTDSHAHTICTQHSLCCCSAAAPIEIVACAAVELSVQFEQRYRAVWRPLSLSLSFSASKTFSLLKCPKSSSNNL